MRRTFVALALLVGPLTPLFAQEPAKDAAGDPLPKGAIARLGTERMRNTDGYSNARLHPDGKRVIASVDNKLVLLDPTTGATLAPFTKGTSRNFAHLSADGSRAVSSTFEGFVVWATDTGNTVYDLKRQLGYDDSLYLSGDGKFLAVGGRKDEKDKKKPVTVTVYDVDGKKEVASLKVAQNEWAKMVLSGDGKRGVSWGYHFEQTKPGEQPDEEKNTSHLLQFWDVAEQKELGTGRLTAGYSVSSVAITTAGDVCAASTGDGTIILFDTATGKKLKELLGRTRVGSKLTFSTDGKTLAAAAFDGAVQLWDVGSGKSLGVAPPPLAHDYLTVQSIVITGPSQAVALTQLSGALMVWEVPSGKIVSPVVGHKEPVTGVMFTSDKELVVSGNYGEVTRWDTTGKRLGDVALTVPGVLYHAPQSARIIAPPGGGVLVRNDGGSALGVYDVKTGVQKFSLPTPFGGEPPVAFSTDGKRMVTGISGGYGAKSKSRLMVIDTTTGTKLTDVMIGPGSVHAVALTPDGKKAGVFRSVSDDKGTTKTIFTGIDLDAGKPLGETEYKGFNTVRLAATSDNKTVMGTAPDTGGLMLYDLTTGKAEPFASGKVSSSFGPVFSPDGKRVAVTTDSYGGPPQIQVYDFEGGKKTHTLRGHLRPVGAMAFSPDGKTLATGSSDTTVLLWDLTKE